jgi:hypothetical protein
MGSPLTIPQERSAFYIRPTHFRPKDSSWRPGVFAGLAFCHSVQFSLGGTPWLFDLPERGQLKGGGGAAVFAQPIDAVYV